MVKDWEFIEQFTNSSDLKEKRFAAYTSVDYNMDTKNIFKVGLRYEYTDSKLNTIKEGKVVDRQFGKLFPSIFYSRTINDNQSLNFAYTKRITRPTFNQMAPFAIFLDPNTFFFWKCWTTTCNYR
jgi:outer membrane receptor protein involved in Fe transport